MDLCGIWVLFILDANQHALLLAPPGAPSTDSLSLVRYVLHPPSHSEGIHDGARGLAG